MTEKFNPMLDRVVVRRLSIATENGVLIPEKYADQKDRGIVLAVGPGRIGVPMTLKVGDKVLIDRHAPMQPVKINEEEVLILYESEIAGTFA